MKKTFDDQSIDIYRDVDNIIDNKGNKSNRIVSEQERELIGQESYDYLLKLYRFGSVDSGKLEKLLASCLNTAIKTQEPLTIENTKSIVNLLLLYDNRLWSAKNVILFCKKTNDEANGEIVN